VIFYARDYLGSTAALLTLVTIITTGAVLYVGPFGPWVTRILGKKGGSCWRAPARWSAP